MERNVKCHKKMKHLYTTFKKFVCEMTGILKTTSLDYRQHYVSQCIYTRTNEEHIKDKKFNPMCLRPIVSILSINV